MGLDRRYKPIVVGSEYISQHNKNLKRTVIKIHPKGEWSFIEWSSTDGNSGVCREDIFKRWVRR